MQGELRPSHWVPRNCRQSWESGRSYLLVRKHRRGAGNPEADSDGAERGGDALRKGGRCHLGSPRTPPCCVSPFPQGPAALGAAPNAPQQIPCSSTKARKIPHELLKPRGAAVPCPGFWGLLPPCALVRARSLQYRLLLSEATYGLLMSIFDHLTSIYGHLMPCPDVAAGGALFSVSG